VAGAFTNLHNFNFEDGCNPVAGVVQGADGNFYGTTAYGGIFDGTIFSITPAGVLSPLHIFNYTDGFDINVGLVQAGNGNFYGTTLFGTLCCGGANDSGTVFEMTPAGTVTTLYRFCAKANCADGSDPYGVVVGTDGNLYGVTGLGGAGNSGTLFKITPGGRLTTLYSFCPQGGGGCTDGCGPYAAPIQATDGNFYGITNACGANGYGTVFKLSVGLPPFVITKPASGKVGATVLILGNNLKGSTAVSFNGTAATFTVVSSSEIKTTVPTGATTGTVKVTLPSGTLNSNVAFQVTQ
jgi:uncharacterized repeat protein (TIGR03803 family)